MLLLVCVALILAVGQCSPLLKAHKYCCPPAQWEGYIGGTGGISAGGNPEGITTVGAVATDRTAKKVYSYTNTTVGTTKTSTKVIQDYSTNTQYVANMLTKTCTKSKITTPYYDGCVPDILTPIGAPLYYGIGSDVLKVKGFFGKLKVGQAQIHVSLMVTEKDCAPVGEAIISSGPSPLVMTVGFVNLTLEIKDPSVFTPPPFCQEVPESQYKSYSVFGV